MDGMQFARVYLLFFSAGLYHSLEVKLKNGESCNEQAKQPYFDIDQVVGKPWRIYYTWNAPMEKKCFDITIKNVTAHITNKIYNDTYDYLEAQPVWDAATLYITIGLAKHELLLFADQGAAGSFLGVPNVIRDANITPERGSVPLYKFFLKLVNNGKYLLMMDCHFGVSLLLSRERPPYHMEVARIANSLNLGYGSPGCDTYTKKDN